MAGLDGIVGDSDALRYVLYRVEQVARTEANVLLCGETGTGKGAARARDPAPAAAATARSWSSTRGAAASLIERAFGHERGASPARTSQIGDRAGA